jgi:hypothetical protein
MLKINKEESRESSAKERAECLEKLLESRVML